MDNLYNQKFTLSDYIWTKYTFDSISMQQDEDQIECGIRCEFSKEQCDFFTVDSGECHLGRYDHWDLGTVQSTSSPMTYHKEGIGFFSDSMSKVPTLFYFNSLSFQILFNGSRMTISYGGLVDIFGTSGKLIFSIYDSREVRFSSNSSPSQDIQN